MNLLRRAAFFLLTIVSTAASAVVLTPLPGSTPQTARPISGFGAPFGVVATDDSGAPLSGVPVTFAMPAADFSFRVLANRDRQITVNTDSQGVATIPEPGIQSGFTAGTFTATATEPGGASTSFALTVAGLKAARVDVVSGAAQIVEANQTLPQPFVARVLDADGVAVPYALVSWEFVFSSLTAGTFPGSFPTPVTKGDAAGVTASPPFTVNDQLGQGRVGARALNQNIFGVFDFIIAAPGTISLTPITGSTPQTTPDWTFYPSAVGVVARNADGSPASGLQVTWSSTIASVGAAFVPNTPTNTPSSTTGADGVAMLPTPGLVAVFTGRLTWIATAPNAWPVVFSLDVVGKGPTRLEQISGDNQTTALNGSLAPWIVRALDDDGQPVPRAYVSFFTPTAAGFPGALFADGKSFADLAADAAGLVFSPQVITNGVAGFTNGLALMEQDGANHIGNLFYFTIAASVPADRLLAWSAPPDSIAIGDTAAIPFTVKFLGRNGRPAAGSVVVFATDPRCGSFGNLPVAVVRTDANGIASSPRFTGKARAMMCSVFATSEGKVESFPMHVFDPSQVTIAVVSAATATINSNYTVSLQFIESGLPVRVTNFHARTIASGSANAAFGPRALMSGDATSLELTANKFTGSYVLEISAGNAVADIAVTQTR